MRTFRSISPSLLPALVFLAAFTGFSTPAATRGSTPAPAAKELRDSEGSSTDKAAPVSVDEKTTEVVLGRICEALGSPTDGCHNVAAPETLEIEEVAKAAGARDVSFLLATVPDYVDSNTAWMADEVLGAIQAAMPHHGYVLDRFYLPEIPQSTNPTGSGARSRDADPHAAALTHGRLHETHPGVMIFRADTGLIVVLIALETATSGLHTIAFENAAHFIRQWQSAAGATPELRVIGPTFSGSVDFMISSLKELAGDRPDTFSSIHVVSGSATHDRNPAVFSAVCAAGSMPPERCSFASAMHSNSETVSGLYRFLQQMQPSWLPNRVALLQESNTQFGLGFSLTLPVGADDAHQPEDDDPITMIDRRVHRYSFPLHISQLREDSRSAPGLPSLLTSPAVALHLGESIRPVDLVPPMRPDVASPLTDLTMAATLDDIKHRGFAAIGIYATDVRDTLYLSREIKRAAPNLQLFYPSGHLLFQHQDFVAYTRGAIVASTYPLSATHQLWGDEHDNGASHNREMFTSTVAEGVFNATLAQVAGDEYLPDYPPRVLHPDAKPRDSLDAARLGPKPGLWLTVVGDDGFWPLRQDGVRAAPRLADASWPITGIIGAVVLLVVVGLHAWVGLARLAEHVGWSWGRFGVDGIRGVALLNVLLPTKTRPEFERLHRVMSAIAFVNVGCLAYWGASVTIVHQFGERAREVAGPVAGLLIVPAVFANVVVTRRVIVDTWTPRRASRSTTSTNHAISLAAWLVPLAYAVVLWPFVASVSSTYWFSADPAFTLFAAARTVGGGIVSPAALVIGLIAAVHVPVLWSLRRLGAVGYGYQKVADSTAFRRLLGSSESIASFAALLDSPIRRLPRSYIGALVLATATIAAVVFNDIATVDGPVFSFFALAASLLASLAALALLVQSLEIWRRLRQLLRGAAELPLREAIGRLGSQRLHWSTSIFSPDTSELPALLGIVDEIRASAQDPGVARMVGPAVDQALLAVSSLPQASEEPLPLTRSQSWQTLWQLADALLPVLESNRWGRRAPPAPGTPVTPSSICLDCAETFLATQRALVLRDVAARVMAGVFTAMVAIGLMTSGHLLYVFQGRQTFFALDTAALFAGAAAAVWILVGMEKDAVLSILWRTTPGRLTFNWSFVQQIVVYGVLPLLIVIGSLFPEVGEKLVLLIEPLRKLTTL